MLHMSVLGAYKRTRIVKIRLVDSQLCVASQTSARIFVIESGFLNFSLNF